MLSCSVEEAKDLTTGALLSALLVAHDAVAGREDQVAKVTGREEGDNPLLHVLHLDVEAGRNDATLVDAANQLDHDLAGASVVHDRELADVLILHHHGEELDDHLGRRS